MLREFKAGLLVTASLALIAGPALALETIVTKLDKNADGTTTYHFTVKVEQGETLTPGALKEASDFVTIYNFYGLVEGSVKSPPGWEFSSEESGRTPSANGYPLVAPVDVPNTPNLTWTATKAVAAGAQADGFSATTRVASVVQGQYSAQVSRQMPTIQGAATGTPNAAVVATKQALLGTLPTPSFLAEVK